MVDRIFSNRPRGTNSAVWQVMDRLWRTIFAPIFTTLSSGVGMDHRSTLKRARSVGELQVL